MYMTDDEDVRLNVFVFIWFNFLSCWSTGSLFSVFCPWRWRVVIHPLLFSYFLGHMQMLSDLVTFIWSLHLIISIPLFMVYISEACI